MGIKKRMVAWFLVLVMVCSMFVAVPVSATEGEDAEQGESVTGFAFTDLLTWDEKGVPTLSEEKSYSNEMWIAPKTIRELAFAYDGEIIEPSENVSITVTKKVNESDEEVSDIISAYGDASPSLWKVSFPDEGEYTITYNVEGVTENNTIKVYVDLPEVGFYTSTTRSVESLVDNNQFVFSDFDAGNSFYMILSAGESEISLAESNPFVVTVYGDVETKITEASDIKENYITWEEVNTGVYKMTVLTDVNFGLDINAVVKETEESRDTGGYINVQYHQSMDGLVTKDRIEWSDAEQKSYVHGDATFSKEVGASVKEEKLFYFAYLSEEGGTETKVTAENLTVKRVDGENETKVESIVSTCESNKDLVMIQFPELGEYVVTYTGDGEKDKSITVYVGYPEVGFYTTATQSVGGILADGSFTYSDLKNEEGKTFYLILKSESNTVSLVEKAEEQAPFVVNTWDESVGQNVKITDMTTITENYISIESVENADGVYKLTALTDVNFGLEVNAQVTDTEGNSWSDSRYIDVRYAPTGLLFMDAAWVYDEEAEREVLSGNTYKGTEAKNKSGEINSICWFWLGTVTDGYFYEYIADDQFTSAAGKNQVVINGKTDYEVVEGEQPSYSDTKDTVILTEHKGIYGFYIRDDINITYGGETITINKELPALAFYKANEASFENLVMGTHEMSESEMKEGKELYVLPRPGIESYTYNIRSCDRTITINDSTFDAIHEEGPGMGTYVSKEPFTEPIKITVSQCATSFVEAFGKITIGTDIYDMGTAIDFSYQSNGENKSIIEDGKSHEGFAGCFISENDYNVNTWGVSNLNYYWVHADTIQGVIDELCRVAEEGSVIIGTDEYDIEATNYIWLNVSYFEYSKAFAESEQHVVTPSNIKGIIMQSGAEHYYAKYGESDYFIMSRFVSENDTKELCYIPDENIYYSVEKLEGEEAETEQADYIVVEDGETYTVEDLATAGYEEPKDEDNNPTFVYPVFYPNLYVDATVEVKIMGNFGGSSANKQVQLGFYEGSTNKSIINGTEFSVANIGDEPVIVGEGTGNEVTVTVTEFKASTECSKAPINGEDCEVTLDGENASLRDKIDIYQKGDDDYADAKELAEGKPLKVKLDVNEAKEDDAEAKKVKEQVEKDCSKDKTKPSKMQYLDIDMQYQVGDRDPKAVTETKEEVDITMDIPDSFQQTGKHAKKRRYKVYRYHDGKVDMLDAEFDKDKKKLHFKTDKFSTYALVAEDVVATGIEVTANPSKLSYVEGEVFDKTGMTISLVYSDGTKEAVTGYTVSTTNALALTDKTVTIAYEDFTVQVPITVLAKTQPGESSGEGSKEEAPQTPSVETPKEEAPQTPAETPQVVLPAIGATTTTTNGDCKVTAIGLDGAVEVTFTPSKSNKKAKKAKIDKTVTIDGKEYAVTAIAAGAFSGNTKMTSISIPDTVTKIGKNAFKGCTKLKKVTIPKNVTEIGNNAFYNCKKVTSVKIKGSSLTKIGTGAFRKCSSLKAVTIPKNVTEIGKDAFRDCKKLNKVTIKGTKLKKIGKNAFKNIAKKPTIKVPKSKKKAYKNLLKKAGYTKTVK